MSHGRSLTLPGPHDTVDGVGDCPSLTTVPIGAVGPGMETDCLVGWFDRCVTLCPIEGRLDCWGVVLSWVSL